MNPETENDLDLEPVHDNVEAPEQDSTQPEQQTKPSDDIAAAMRELATTVGKVAQPQRSAEPTKPTPEQLEEYWGLYNPTKADPQFFRKFLGLAADMDPEAAKAREEEFRGLFESMHTGIARQAVIGAQRLFQQELQKLREEYAPLQEHYSNAQREATRNRFYESYPTLKDSKFDPIIKAVSTALSGQEFRNEAEFFKALAEGAAGHIKGLLPDFDLSTNKQKNGTTPRLPRSRVGGTGGAGGQKNEEAPKDDSASIWGDDGL